MPALVCAVGKSVLGDRQIAVVRSISVDYVAPMHRIIVPPGCMRLVLAFMVVLAHYSALSGARLYSPIDGIAVYGFFFLSGFWIRRLWENRYSRCRAPLLTFYISRAWRLYPLAAISTFTMLAISKEATWTSLLRNLAMVDVPLGFGINPPIWSLAVEVQFYIIAPLLFLLLRYRIGACALVLLGLWGVIKFVPGTDHTWLFYFTLFFTLGALYSGFPRHDLTTKLTPWVLAGFFICCVAPEISLVRALLPTTIFSMPRVAPVILTLLCLPYIAASLSKRSDNNDRMLGNLAYPVYLMHWPIYQWLAKFSPDHIVMPGLLVTAAVSIILFVLIDRPLEALRDRFVTQRQNDGLGAIQTAAPVLRP